MAQTEVRAFALSKKFLMRKVFPQYPQIFREIKDDSKYRYNSCIKDPVMRHKYQYIEVVNKRNTYNAMQLRPKMTAEISAQQLLLKNAKIEDGTQNLRMQFQERIVGIEQEVSMIDASLGEFLSTFTTDFNGLMTKIDQMQENMSQLKEERVRSQGDLQKA